MISHKAEVVNSDGKNLTNGKNSDGKSLMKS